MRSAGEAGRNAKPLDPKENNHLLRLRVSQLEAVLASAGMELPPEVPEQLRALTPQQMALYQVLAGAKGRCLSRFQIECAIPARDHAEDRSYHYVDVLVSHVRKKLGAEVIVNERGRGYRLGRAVG